MSFSTSSARSSSPVPRSSSTALHRYPVADSNCLRSIADVVSSTSFLCQLQKYPHIHRYPHTLNTERLCADSGRRGGGVSAERMPVAILARMTADVGLQQPGVTGHDIRDRGVAVLLGVDVQRLLDDQTWPPVRRLEAEHWKQRASRQPGETHDARREWPPTAEKGRAHELLSERAVARHTQHRTGLQRAMQGAGEAE